MMIEETDSFLDGFSRGCIDFSSKLAEPFCWSYGMLRYRSISPLDPNKFDNTSSKAQEVGKRALILGAAALACYLAAHVAIAGAAVLATGALAFRAIGFALQKNQFTHVRGLAPETALAERQAKVMVWSLCGERGGLSYRKGGVIHWRSRLDRIVEKINKESPDVIVLQEINDTALAEALIAKLKGEYAHFFTHLGGGVLQQTNGCLVITKCAVERFSHRDLPNQTSYEAFEIKAHASDELPCIRFIATQLIPGQENETKRMEQVAHIVRGLVRDTFTLPTFFLATNAHLDSKTEKRFLSQYLEHSYRAPEPTRTDQLAIQWDSSLQEEETFDTISLFKRRKIDGTFLPVSERNIRMIYCRVVEAFDRKTYDTQKALSNSQGIVTFLAVKDI